jgi:hypothetical protein
MAPVFLERSKVNTSKSKEPAHPGRADAGHGALVAPVGAERFKVRSDRAVLQCASLAALGMTVLQFVIPAAAPEGRGVEGSQPPRCSASGRSAPEICAPRPRCKKKVAAKRPYRSTPISVTIKELAFCKRLGCRLLPGGWGLFRLQTLTLNLSDLPGATKPHAQFEEAALQIPAALLLELERLE